MERAKPQAAIKFIKHTGKNVSRKTHKPAWLRAIPFQNYEYNGQYILLLFEANFTCHSADLLSLH